MPLTGWLSIFWYSIAFIFVVDFTDFTAVVLAARGVAFPELSQLLIDESWQEVLREEMQKQYMEKLYQFVLEEAGGKFPIYPPPAKVFNAFNTCPFNSVKVVILGQVRAFKVLWGNMVSFRKYCLEELSHFLILSKLNFEGLILKFTL